MAVTKEQRSWDLIQIFYIQAQSSFCGTQQSTTGHRSWLHDCRDSRGSKWTLQWFSNLVSSFLAYVSPYPEGMLLWWRQLRRKAGSSSRITVKTICFVNLMWTLQMCDGAEATSFYRWAISWVNMAPLPWPSKEALQRKRQGPLQMVGTLRWLLLLNSEGLGVNANWFDFAVYEHLCGWVSGCLSLSNSLCVAGLLLSDNLNGKVSGTTCYGKVSRRWVSANDLVLL